VVNGRAKMAMYDDVTGNAGLSGVEGGGGRRAGGGLWAPGLEFMPVFTGGRMAFPG